MQAALKISGEDESLPDAALRPCHSPFSLIDLQPMLMQVSSGQSDTKSEN